MKEKLPEIKPCPFCGSGANVEFAYNSCGRREGVIVQCFKCGAQTDRLYCFDNEPPLEEVVEEAISLWNRRVIDNETD